MNKFLTKATAFAVAAILATTPMSALAASGSTPSQSTNSSSGAQTNSNQDNNGNSSASTVVQKSTASVMTASGAVKSTVGGSYTATVVNGTAVVTPKADVNAAFALKRGETATIVVRDSRAGEAAKKCFTHTASALGLVMGPIIDFAGMATTTKGSRTVARFTQDVSMVVGIPASMRTENVEYAMIRVVPGGQIDILTDNDEDPDTITFLTNASGAYMLVAAPKGYFEIFATLTFAK